MDAFTKTTKALQLTAAQMLTVAVLFWLATTLEATSPTNWEHMPWGVLLYLGMIASTLCTLLQAWGQQVVAPTQSALIYALEPVWATAFAVLLFAQPLSWSDVVGGGLMVAAVLWSQRSN